MKSPYRTGVMVILGLAALTAMEYGVAQVGGMIIPLLLIGVFKAALIVKYYMHVSHLWGEEGEVR